MSLLPQKLINTAEITFHKLLNFVYHQTLNGNIVTLYVGIMYLYFHCVTYGHFLFYSPLRATSSDEDECIHMCGETPWPCIISKSGD